MGAERDGGGDLGDALDRRGDRSRRCDRRRRGQPGRYRYRSEACACRRWRATRLGARHERDGDAEERLGYRRRPGRQPRTGCQGDRSGGSQIRVPPSRRTARGHLAALSGAPAARAHERFVGVPFSMTSGWRFGLHPAVGADAVHPRRLRVEAAHRNLAADRAGAGHAGPLEGSIGRASPDGPERSGIIAHGLPTALPGPSPARHPRRTSPRANRSSPGRSLVTRQAVIDIVRAATLGSYGVTGFAARPARAPPGASGRPGRGPRRSRRGSRSSST